jgi:predicted Zn-dependent protease
VAGEDYFAAQFNPSTQAYLESIENRHASERVWALYRAGKYSEPLGDCKYVLARFPNHPRALHLLGEIAKTTEQLTMPIPYFERALKYYPQHAYTHAQYGHYLVEISATSAGIAELMEALRRDPNQLQAQAWLAQAMSAQGMARSAQADSAKTAPAPGKSTSPAGTRN